MSTSKLTSGSNMLWESSRMMLPQNKEAIQERQREGTKRQRVEHDDQEKEQISRFLTMASQTRRSVRLRMFDQYEDVYVIGTIERIDSTTARFKVDGEWFHIEDIAELAWGTQSGDY